MKTEELKMSGSVPRYKNIQQSCYLNALAQVFVRMPRASRVPFSLDRNLTRERAAVAELAPHLVPGTQHDVHELFLTLATEAWKITMTRDLTCACQRVTRVHDSSLGLSLAVPKVPNATQDLTVIDLLHHQFAPETVPFQCACGATESHATWSDVQWPTYLALHFKRFQQLGHSFKKKSDPIVCPHTLLLPAAYERVAVIMHHGALNHGHYTTAVLNSTEPYQWVRCDDEEVSIVSDERIIESSWSPAIYMAIYIKK